MKYLKSLSVFVSIVILGLVGCTLTSCAVDVVESSYSTPESGIEVNDKQSIAGPESLPELPIVKFDDLTAELTHLQRVNQDFLSRPGWYHYEKTTWNSSLVDQQESGDGPFSTAGMFPPIQIHEEWFQVLDKKAALGLGHFSVTRDENGIPVQVVASDSQGNGGNLTLLERGLTEAFSNNVTEENEAVFADPVRLTSSIEKIINGLERVKDFSPEINAGYINHNGVEEYQVLIRTAVINEPYEFNWVPEPISDFITFYRIDLLTGTILEITEFDVGLSGEVYKTFSETTQIAEIIDQMPDDVRQRYEMALNQYRDLLDKGE